MVRRTASQLAELTIDQIDRTIDQMLRKIAGLEKRIDDLKPSDPQSVKTFIAARSFREEVRALDDVIRRP
jgi:hypothetical protein